MITTDSGLQFEDTVAGNGVAAQAGDTIEVHYTGTLADGLEFDSSRSRGPFTFQLGMGQVILGWDEGVVGMKVGGQRTLIIPPHLAYGDSGAGHVIPPGATLHFAIELLAIN